MAESTLPDLLHWTSQVRGEEVVYRFSNGLAIKTDVPEKDDSLRILPLGRPQGALMNRIANFPSLVRGRLVFDPFAGSGALGFMALKAGARHVDFLDINPRAVDYQRENAALNAFSSSRFRSIQGDIADFEPDGRYDLILANPPFVPAPEDIPGTITSNAGPEGNRLVDLLLDRMERLLQPRGEAFIYLYQFARDGLPLVAETMMRSLLRRRVDFTPCQESSTPCESYFEAYRQHHPAAAPAIDRWRADILQRYGNDLALSHYIAHIWARSGETTSCVVRNDFPERFGAAFLIPSGDQDFAPIDGRRR